MNEAEKQRSERTAQLSAYSHLKEVGDYKLVRLLGVGGMGEVFLAEQKSMSRLVALKILSPALLNNRSCMERFFQEVRTLAKIEHPNIVRALEAGVDGDVCFFSMHYVNGKDVSAIIQGKTRLGELEALKIIATLARTLAFAWNKHRLIHRDIKPSNIMINRAGNVELLDFGIAKFFPGTRNAEPAATMPGMMVGSPHYISPEQAKAGEVDCRADMYSLGATLYNMLTGEPPYDADSTVGIVARHISDRIPDVRKINQDVSRATSQLIRKLLAKNAEDRFASWEDAAIEIERIIFCLEGAEIAAPEAAGQPERRSLRRILRLVAALALLIVALVMLVRYSMKEAERKRANAAFAATISNAKKSSVEQYPQAIAGLERVIKTAPPAYAKAAREILSQINQDIAARRRHTESIRLKASLKKLRARSFKLESGKRFSEAIRLWNFYRKTGEFRNNARFKEEAENAIRHLKIKQAKINTGY